MGKFLGLEQSMGRHMQKTTKFKSKISRALLATLFLASGNAQAAVFTTSFTPKLIMSNTCTLQVRRNLDFGTAGLLTANIDQFARIRVRCNSGTHYEIGLDEGTTSGGTTAVRKMTNGAQTIDYKLFKNNARTNNWGNIVGVDTRSRTANGNWQGRRIFGRVEPQATPSSGTYTDTVTVTITF